MSIALADSSLITLIFIFPILLYNDFSLSVIRYFRENKILWPRRKGNPNKNSNTELGETQGGNIVCKFKTLL